MLTQKQIECSHINFYATVAVNRIENQPDRLEGLMADIMINCNDCELPMYFRGMAAGLSWGQPRTDIIQKTAHLPLWFEGKEDLGLHLTGFNVTGSMDPDRTN